MVSRGDGRSDERAGALPGTPIVGTSGRGPCVIDAERFEYAHAAGRFILPAPAAGGRTFCAWLRTRAGARSTRLTVEGLPSLQRALRFVRFFQPAPHGAALAADE